MIGKQFNCPPALSQLRDRFESWRKKKENRTEPIPEALWVSAVSLARKYGLNIVTKVLRLEYYSLRKRVENLPEPRKSIKPEICHHPQFVELTQPVLVPECSLEFENPSGAKLKVQLKGAANLDLVALGQAFWRTQS
jgi:hypothetical protein